MHVALEELGSRIAARALDDPDVPGFLFDYHSGPAMNDIFSQVISLPDRGHAAFLFTCI